jgi:hypothetical protein
MTVDWQPWAIAILTIASGVGGWIMRELWDATKTLRKDLEALKVKIPENYVSHARMHEFLNPIMRKLERIEDFIITPPKDK